jgi:hypothetical protein
VGFRGERKTLRTPRVSRRPRPTPTSKRRATLRRARRHGPPAAGRMAPGARHGLGFSTHRRRRRARAAQWAPRPGRTAAALYRSSTRKGQKEQSDERQPATQSGEPNQCCAHARTSITTPRMMKSIDRRCPDRVISEHTGRGVDWTRQSAACPPRERGWSCRPSGRPGRGLWPPNRG